MDGNDGCVRDLILAFAFSVCDDPNDRQEGDRKLEVDGVCGGFTDGIRPCGLFFGDAFIWRLKSVAAATWDRRRRKEKPPRAAKKHTECAVPAGLPPKAAKGFNWIVRICCLCVLLRGLQNLESSLKRF